MTPIESRVQCQYDDLETIEELKEEYEKEGYYLYSETQLTQELHGIASRVQEVILELVFRKRPPER